VVENGRLSTREVPLRNAMNEDLRSSYILDAERVVRRWNKALDEEGIAGFEFKLPHRRFFRRQGIYAGQPFDLSGNLMDEAAYRDFLKTLD
jgi:benzoyl-CoA 2,3-dioxygenase component B